MTINLIRYSNKEIEDIIKNLFNYNMIDKNIKNRFILSIKDNYIIDIFNAALENKHVKNAIYKYIFLPISIDCEDDTIINKDGIYNELLDTYILSNIDYYNYLIYEDLYTNRIGIHYDEKLYPFLTSDIIRKKLEHNPIYKDIILKLDLLIGFYLLAERIYELNTREKEFKNNMDFDYTKIKNLIKENNLIFNDKLFIESEYNESKINVLNLISTGICIYLFKNNIDSTAIDKYKELIYKYIESEYMDEYNLNIKTKYINFSILKLFSFRNYINDLYNEEIINIDNYILVFFNDLDEDRRQYNIKDIKERIVSYSKNNNLLKNILNTLDKYNKNDFIKIDGYKRIKSIVLDLLI